MPLDMNSLVSALPQVPTDKDRIAELERRNAQLEATNTQLVATNAQLVAMVAQQKLYRQ